MPDSLSRAAFYSHRTHAKARGIGFEFSYAEWRLWWETELARLGPRARRGVGRRQYGMCRILDRGPYASGNVRAARPRQNRAEYCVSVYLNAPPLPAEFSLERTELPEIGASRHPDR